MTERNFQNDIVSMLKDKGYIEAPSDNKSWRIFFQADTPDTRWFVHEGGKVRRGKSVHNSAAITPEARRMLGRWLSENRVKKEPPKKAEPPKEKKAKAPKKEAEPPKKSTFNKALAIFEALNRDDGATIQELMDLTGWQKHTVRGYLSNLRKKLDNQEMIKSTRDDNVIYRIEPKEKTDE